MTCLLSDLYFIFFLILSNYLLSRTIFVLFIATMPTIAMRRKCLLGQLDSSVYGIKDVSFLELLIYCSLCSIFLKMEIARKQRMWEMYGWTPLQPGSLADGWCPLNDWEHWLAHYHSSLFQRVDKRQPGPRVHLRLLLGTSVASVSHCGLS